MLAGKLDRRIRLERAAVTQDEGSGENVETWATLGPAKIWARWRRASARETLAAAEVSAEVADVFEIRWDSSVSSVNPKDRLIYEDRVYAIATVDEIGRREGLRIAASARAD
jgi:SPP1 family predicted phage head-tail adaptor